MTVSTTDITSGPYLGNDVNDQFSYTFRVVNEDQLTVFEFDDTGTVTTLAVDTDYTVSDIGDDSGGTVTRLAGPLPTGYTWLIRSNYQPVQERSFPNQGPFFPRFHEAAMDKLTFLVQQLYDLNQRTIRLPDYDLDPLAVGVVLANVGQRAGKVLGFDSNGNVIYPELSVSTFGGKIYPLATALVDPSLQPNQIVDTTGYDDHGDGGGNRYRIHPVGTAPSYDGGKWIYNAASDVDMEGLFPGGRRNIKQWGARGDGISDDTVPIQSAINYVNQNPGRLSAPRGTFLVTESQEPDTWPIFGGGTRDADTAALILRAGVKLSGESRDSVKIQLSDASKTIMYLANHDDSVIENITFDGAYDGITGAGAGLFNVVSNLDDDVVNTIIQNVRVDNVGGYGIGLNEGHLLDCRLLNIGTDFTGADGLDVKSRSTDLSIDTGNYVNNFTATRFGIRVTGSTGVDIRGRWNINGVFARGFGAQGVPPFTGFRLRPESEANNIARQCNVSNIVVDGGSNSDTRGAFIQGRFCNVSNVTVDACELGVVYAGSVFDAQYNSLSNVVVTNHMLYAFQSTVSGKDISVSNFTAASANGATAHFRIEGSGCTFTNCYGDNSATEFSIGGTAVDSFTRESTNAVYTDTIDSYEIAAGRAALQARGPSADIDVNLIPKGSGLVRFGAHSGVGAETITGFIEVKDNAGSVRKIAVIS